MKKLILSAALIAVSLTSFAQIGVGTNSPEGALDVVSTDSGFLMPRMADEAAVTTPVEGMQVYNTTTKKVMLYDGTQWVEASTDALWETVLRNGDTNLTPIGLNTATDSTFVGQAFFRTETLTGSGTYGSAQMFGYGSTYSGTGGNNQPTLNFFRADGVAGAPTAVSDGTWIGRLNFLGHNGTTSTAGWSQFGVRVDENAFPIGIRVPLSFVFSSRKESGAITEIMRLRPDGNVGIGTSTPGSKLSVLGLVEYADNAAAISAGLTAGDFYRTADGTVKVVF